MPNLTILDFDDHSDSETYYGVENSGAVDIWTRRLIYVQGGQELRWCPKPCGETPWALLGCGVFTLRGLDSISGVPDDSEVSMFDSEEEDD